MQFSSYLANIEASIRGRGVTPDEIALTYVDASSNRTYDGEWTWTRGTAAARVLRGTTPQRSVIQWLDGPKIDHTSPSSVVEDTTDVARLIIDRLRRGF